jgi:hypothetical protein
MAQRVVHGPVGDIFQRLWHILRQISFDEET